MSVLNPPRVSKVEHQLFDADGTNVKVSLVFTDDGEPILGIDTSEGEVVSLSGDVETLDTLARTISLIRAAVYGD